MKRIGRSVFAFERRVRRKAQLEEDIRNRQLQAKREAQEHRHRLEQARVDRLFDEAVSLRRATDIRAYVDAVRAVLTNEIASISSEKIELWSSWALAEADRIDPVKSARFLRAFDAQDDAN